MLYLGALWVLRIYVSEDVARKGHVGNTWLTGGGLLAFTHS